MLKKLLPEERLDALRAVDVERKWYSLDDKRICTVCDRIFTGRQIEISCEPSSGYSLKCPTPGCPSNFRHWLLCELSAARYPAAASNRGYNSQPNVT